MTLTRDFDDTYPTQPAGLDQQGRYRTRPHRATDQDYGSLYRRAPMDEVVRCHRNGQPIAGEACADTSDQVKRQPGDGVLTVLMWVVAAVFTIVVLGHAVARWWA